MTEHDVLKLENQLCFPLYAAAKEVVSQYKPLLSDIDLTYTQYITMMVLWEYGSASVGEIGDRLYLDSGTLTPLLKRLEAKGLIRRERSATDERTVVISLTDDGVALEDRAAQVPLKLATCMPLSQDESQTLYQLLYKLLENFTCGHQASQNR